jgi:hypothetical protein
LKATSEHLHIRSLVFQFSEAREQKNKFCKEVVAEVAAEVAAVASGSSYSAASMVDDTHAATHAPSPWVEGSDTHAPSP